MEALDDKVNENRLSPDIAQKIVAHFDTAINAVLCENETGHFLCKATIEEYKVVDEVYLFRLKDVAFRMGEERKTVGTGTNNQGAQAFLGRHPELVNATMERLKVVACKADKAAKKT